MRPSPELRVLRALDELRDAFAELFAAEPAEPTEGDRLLTLTNAARRLGVARSTVSRWADAGRVRTVGPPHARRVHVAELERLRRETGDAA